MLRFLSIRNLAVIDAAEIEFQPGFNVLTGETGAGKSILLGAVGLLVGGRASAEVVRTGEEAATIQAVFDQPDGRDLIVRREITGQGRSRAFINDTLVTAGALKEISVPLVELHGQHEHQALLDPDSHLDLLDAQAGLSSMRREVTDAFAAMSALSDTLESLQLDDREKLARLDLLRFQIGEIDRVAPRAGEDDELEVSRQVLASAERLQRLCAESYASLYENDRAVLAGLGQVWRRVGELAEVDPRFRPYLEARAGIKSQLEDLAEFLRGYADDIDASPARLQEIEERLATLVRVKRKYGPTLEAVLAERAELDRRLTELQMSSQRAGEIEAALRTAESRYLAHARPLSTARRTASVTWCRALERRLATLAMERTRIEFRFDAASSQHSWTDRGVDRAELFLSPNPGEEMRPLARIASGGELSRIMLALKALAAADAPGKTLIFDEVDAGIGGRVADVVGSTMKALGADFQVLCVTHLPQIASYATTHFQISKHVRQNRTVTRVARLDAAARIDEVARMMGGAAITDQVRGSAQELIERGAIDGPPIE